MHNNQQLEPLVEINPVASFKTPREELAFLIAKRIYSEDGYTPWYTNQFKDICNQRTARRALLFLELRLVVVKVVVGVGAKHVFWRRADSPLNATH